MPVLAARRISDSVWSSKVADLRGVVRGMFGSMSVRVRVVDVEIVELARRAVAAELGRVGIEARAVQEHRARLSTCSGRISFSTQSAPRPATLPRTKSRAS